METESEKKTDFSSVKIKNPKTGRMINLYGNTYYDLINKEGYSESYLRSLSSKKVKKVTFDDNITIIENRIIDYDIYYNILMHSDYKTIKNLCLTNITSIKVCDSKFFWNNKFIYDNIPILTSEKLTNRHEWINEYIRVSLAKDTAINIIKVWLLELDKSKLDKPVMIQIQFNKSIERDILHNLIPFAIDDKLRTHRLRFVRSAILNNIDLIVGIREQQIFTISYELAVQILTKILYHLPNIDITDQNNISFHLNRLIKNPGQRGSINIIKKRIKLYKKLFNQ